MRLLALFAAVVSGVSFGAVDTFGVGNGQDGSFTAMGTQVLSTSAQVTAINAAKTQLTIGAAAAGQFGFAANRLVLVIASTGLASSPSGNQSVINLTGVVGAFELARVQTASATSLTLVEPLTANYAAQTTQVVAVPEFTNVTVPASATLTATAWNGARGGVLAFLASGTVTVNGSINANATGFRGGVRNTNTDGLFGCTELDSSAADFDNAGKGEGLVLAAYGPSFRARGNIANGAGGGVCHNSGGGGGGHRVVGGIGGNSLSNLPGSAGDGNRAVGGLGGAPVAYDLLTHLVFGGGGGAGHGNEGANSSGAAGGGTVFIRSASLSGIGRIEANGGTAFNTDRPLGPGTPLATGLDAAGGGGAGGSLSIRVTGNITLNCANIQALGGSGGNHLAEAGNNRDRGPGGGGAGGRILLQGVVGAGCRPNACEGKAGDSVINGGGTNNGSDGATPAVACNGAVEPIVTDNPLRLPVVAISTPANGGTVNTATPTYSGTATPGSTVSLVVDGVPVAGCANVAVTAAGTWSCSPNAPVLTEGSHTVTATSSIGRLTSTVASSTFRVGLDSDMDGVPDAVEVMLGTNPNNADSDGDGINDNYELSPGNGGAGPFSGVNTDGRGGIDALDRDSDDDGIPDAVERDLAMSGGVPADFDGDGRPNYRDFDSDDDGIFDTIETGSEALDSNRDGVLDSTADADGDGIVASVDTNDAVVGQGSTVNPPNTDMADKANYLDTDSDGDTVLDSIEAGATPNSPANTDGDLPPTPDYLDLDSDNDCVSDVNDLGAARTNPALPKANANDNCPSSAPVCLAATGTCTAATDADGDGVPDSVEVMLGTNPNNPDSDGDGIWDNYELSTKGDGVGPFTAVNSDGNGPIDALDTDSDDDGIPDSVERGGAGTGLNNPPVDSDRDGTADFRDLDSDNDTIPDRVEAGANPATPVNSDPDALPDYLDTDSDNDTVLDSVEAGPNPVAPANSDNDNPAAPDYLDIDSDNDCLKDAMETAAGRTNAAIPGAANDNCGGATPVCDTTKGVCVAEVDSDGDGVPDAVEMMLGTNPNNPDSDNDGILDNFELSSTPDGKGPFTPVNTDNNGPIDALDTDSDDDGILDALERDGAAGTAPQDFDGDKNPNYRDLDSDADGIPDKVEAGANPSAPVNTDGLDKPNYLDVDSDADGVDDKVEAGVDPRVPSNTDNDKPAVPDYVDLDSDNDCVPDRTDLGADRTNPAAPKANASDNCPASTPVCLTDRGVCAAAGDSDGDGVLDSEEVMLGTNPNNPDSDGDGIYDNVELSAAGDGVGPFTAVNTDGTGPIDALDTDSDDDGIPDSVERDGPVGQLPADKDGDGKPNFRDLDSDADTIPDKVEAGANPTVPVNTDGVDGPNYLDTDSDNDSYLDSDEVGANKDLPVNTDRDFVGPDYLDLDSDNDCLPDSRETATGRIDAAVPGSPNANCPATAPICTLSTGQCATSPDSDGDGVPDNVEMMLGTNPNNPDSDGDGIPDNFELSGDGKGTGPFSAVNSDGTGPIDALDTDSDDDGIPDAVEADVNMSGVPPGDFDADGAPNFRDLDSDNDGIPDAVEAGKAPTTPVNTDGSDKPNYLDLDSDNDGFSDTDEAGVNAASPANTDQDQIGPDYVDTDSDNDCVPDMTETAAGRIDALLPKADANANCPATAPVCNRFNGTCGSTAGCGEDSQCMAGQICSEQMSVCTPGCRNDSQCTNGATCNVETKSCQDAGQGYYAGAGLGCSSSPVTIGSLTVLGLLMRSVFNRRRRKGEGNFE
jgi:Bacterial Ig-like domain/Bacterial TSP3 repeat